MKNYIREVENAINGTAPIKLANTTTIKNSLNSGTIDGIGTMLDDLDAAMRIRLKKIVSLATPDQARFLGQNLRAAHAHKHYRGIIKLFGTYENQYEINDLDDEVMQHCYEMRRYDLDIHQIDKKGLLCGGEMLTQMTYSVTPYDGVTQFLDILESFTNFQSSMGVVIGEIGGREYLYSHHHPFPQAIPMPDFHTPLVIQIGDEEFRTDQIWRYRQMLHNAL